MYRNLRLSKKTIIWLKKIAVFILFIAGSFGFVGKVYTDSGIYDFSLEYGESRRAYRRVDSNPTTSSGPNIYDSEAGEGEYADISSPDDTRWEVADATGNFWDSQIYTFEINEDISSITELILEWEGYGETCTGFTTNFYIWNLSSNGWWELLDSRDYTSSVDVPLNETKITNLADYINSINNNRLALMTSTQRGKLLGESCGGNNECCSGHCADGVCCNGSCSGDCEDCNLTGTKGTCTSVTADDYKGCDASCTHCADGNCDYWPNNEQYEECNGFCKACDGNGNCSDADAGYDPGTDCGTSNCYTGECNGSGACDWYTSGERNCPACQTCDGASSGSCVNIANGTQESQGSNTCTDYCYGCYGGSCRAADSGDDPGNDCDAPPGISSARGCATDYCDGTGKCAVYTSGDHECPACLKCGNDLTEACDVKYDHGTLDSTGGIGQTCDGTCKYCSNGGCVYESTYWGADQYGCEGINKRCVFGGCRTCPGLVFRKGTGFENGLGCWVRAAENETCNDACSSLGQCLGTDWTDSLICEVCKHWYPQEADCYMDWGNPPLSTELAAPYWAPLLWGPGICHRRPKTDYVNWHADCGAAPPPGGARRFCVCNW